MIYRKYGPTILCILLTITQMQAQKFKYAIPGIDTLAQNFIVSGAASTVLSQGRSEVILNNSLTSYWVAVHANGNDSPVLDRFRNTSFNTDLAVYYGVSQSGMWDLGLQLGYVRTRLDNSALSSPLKVFDKVEDPTPDENALNTYDKSFGGVANAGIRLRYRPFRYVPEFLLSGGYSVTTIADEFKRQRLNADRNFFDVAASYYKMLAPNIYYFLNSSLRGYGPAKSASTLPGTSSEGSQYISSFNFFIIKRTGNQKFTFYPGLNYNLAFRPSTYDAKPLVKISEFFFLYAGIQYSITTKHNIFFNAGLPLFITVTNPQLEIVRESYSTLSLGANLRF